MIPAPLFLDQVVPGWEWERADELNQALRRLGPVELGTIAHGTVRGILRFYPGDARTPVRHNGQMAPVRTVYARSYTTELRHERWSLVNLKKVSQQALSHCEKYFVRNGSPEPLRGRLRGIPATAPPPLVSDLELSQFDKLPAMTRAMSCPVCLVRYSDFGQLQQHLLEDNPPRLHANSMVHTAPHVLQDWVRLAVRKLGHGSLTHFGLGWFEKIGFEAPEIFEVSKI
ncbi:C2H2-type domain-containing protein [Caenorhabditis elegans]|uniref:C2H2-type domain-containing protein n=1 Tax=Caenorhabditis elegans TaxID=6239 RepID=O45537_CAEEL|nr:C2H2-type domain-containing protein [Caenorhabditis elegans]CAB04425.2 C2H2-type domain-containing protein [Caenorhabditis elegans]